MPAAYAGIIAAVIGAAGSAYAANEQGNDAAEAARQSSTSRSDVNPWAPSVPYLTASMQQASNWGNAPLPYTNPREMVAGLTPAQELGMIQMLQGGNSLVPAANNLGPTFARYTSGSMMDVDNNPYLQRAIDAAVRPITRNYEEQVLPNIRSQYVADDAYNQSRQGIAEGIAGRGYLDAVSDVASQMANRGYETGMQATQRSFDQFPQVAQGVVTPGQTSWNVGALLQAQMQKEADAKAAFDRMQLERITLPYDLYRSAGGIGRDSATSGITQNPFAKQNPVTAGIGGALTGYQLYNMFKQPNNNTQSTNYTTGYNIYGGQDLGQADYGQGSSNVWYGW